MANQDISWRFSHPIPGSSLTKAPKSTPWQLPPKFTKLSEACDFIFDQLCQEPKLHQLLAMFKSGVSVEALARIIIFSGFSTGYWTPDLGMLMAKPIMYMLAGIAQRAGLSPKLTHADRDPLKKLIGLKRVMGSGSSVGSDFNSSQAPITMPKGAPQGAKGLLAPIS